MDNHFHLLVLSPKEDIDRVMYFFMKKLSLQIRKETKRINHIFSGRYKGCLLIQESYRFNVYKYLYRNPVKAGLGQRIEEYPYSSWKDTPVKMKNLFFPERKTASELKWLNRQFEKVQEEGIKRSLKRTVFAESREWKGEEKAHYVF